LQNAEVCCGFVQTGFRSSDSSQYSEKSGSNFAGNYKRSPPG